MVGRILMFMWLFGVLFKGVPGSRKSGEPEVTYSPCHNARGCCVLYQIPKGSKASTHEYLAPNPIDTSSI